MRYSNKYHGFTNNHNMYITSKLYGRKYFLMEHQTPLITYFT